MTLIWCLIAIMLLHGVWLTILSHDMRVLRRGLTRLSLRQGGLDTLPNGKGAEDE